MLAGSYGRYSSTHRVALTSTDTWDYIWARASHALSTPPLRGKEGGGDWSPLMVEQMRLCEEVHSEIESEWLRPWGAQGREHAATHSGYWGERMGRLHQAWESLEARTAGTIALLTAAVRGAEKGRVGGGGDGLQLLPEGVRAFDVLSQQLSKRGGTGDAGALAGRAGWQARLASKAYQTLPPSQRPFDFPKFSSGSPVDSFEPSLAGLGLKMPREDVTELLSVLRALRAAFVQQARGGGVGRSESMSSPATQADVKSVRAHSQTNVSTKPAARKRYRSKSGQSESAGNLNEKPHVLSGKHRKLEHHG